MTSSSTRTGALGQTAVKLLDGGTGEELFRLGMEDDRKIWSARALVDDANHELLINVHMSFLAAGSDFITCNNYGVTPGVGFSDEEIKSLTSVAGELVVEARRRSGKTEAKICGSLPPLLESYRADRVVAFGEGVRLYKLIGAALAPFVDLFLAETLSSIAEAKMALNGVREFQRPAMVSFTLNNQGSIRSGETVCDAIEALLNSSNNGELFGILFNCSQPEAITLALGEIHQSEMAKSRLAQRSIQLGAYANRLTVISDDWTLAESTEPQAMRIDLDPEQYNRFVLQWIDLGATLIGGCCGIGPEYIANIRQLLDGKKLR